MNDIPTTKAISYMCDSKGGKYRKPVNHTVIPKLQHSGEWYTVHQGYHLRHVWPQGR